MRYITTTITVSLPYRIGDVNCYLIDSGKGFVLIDTGSTSRRADLESKLIAAGCSSGDLKLIALTHGDFDHTGNAAYIRHKFGTKIALHRDDSGMVERGDMTWNRKKLNIIVRIVFLLLFRLSGSDRFIPDLFIEDGDDLSEYGFEAKVIDLPGHSMGSTGFLTASGDLFCGDLLENTDGPGLNSIMDDPTAAQASVNKLRNLDIVTVYPGHGKPFSGELFAGLHRAIEDGEQ